MKLHTVNHTGVKRNRYCGPSALSILTGLDTGRTAALLRKVSGKRSIKGTSTSSMRHALRALGIDALGNNTPTKVSLVQWLRRTRDSRGAGTYLIVVGNHWAIIQGRRYACGLTKKPVSFKDAPKRRARVTEVYSLARLWDVKVNEVTPVPVRPADPERKDRETAKKLAAQWGIEIDNDREATGNGGCLWVYPPACLHDEYGEMPEDPYTEHCHDTWGNALKAVETYARLAEAATHRGDGGVKSLLDKAAEPAILSTT